MAIDFGVHEPVVRWIEDTARPGFWEAAFAAVNNARDRDSLLLAGALASARAVDPKRVPRWLLQLNATHEWLREMEGSVPPEAGLDLRLPVVRFLHGVHEACRQAPFQLPELPGPHEGAKEDLTYAFLEAVLGGDEDAADHRFSSLASDLGREEAGDLLFSSGLEALTGSRDTLLGVVEALSALQRIGWEWGPVLLRPIVRQQATPALRSELYGRAVHAVASRQLLRRARRRAPGVPSLGATDPRCFLASALEWAAADAAERMEQMAAMLEGSIALEDAGELVSLASTLIFVQEALRRTPWTEEEADERIGAVAGARSVRRLLHLAPPGQRILGLLLAGAHPGVRDLRLRPEAPECGWWLSPASRWMEQDSSAAATGSGNGEDRAVRWTSALIERRTNALLPLVEEMLDHGETVGRLCRATARVSADQEVGEGFAIALERVLADAYEATRAPHRWIHVWASGLAQCLWPGERSGRTGDLRASNPFGTFP